MDLDALRKKMKAKKATLGSHNEPKIWVLAIVSQDDPKIYSQDDLKIYKFHLAKSQVSKLSQQIQDNMNAFVEQYNDEASLEDGLKQKLDYIYDGETYILCPWQDDELFGDFICQIAKVSGSRDSESNVNASEKSYSDKIFDEYIADINSLLDSDLDVFSYKVGRIQKIINNENLSDYEADRLRLLQMVLNLFYFDAHFLDDDFDDKEDKYYGIIDSVDNLIDAMKIVTDEAVYVYLIANLFSADRFQNIAPSDKLEEIWQKIKSIELDNELTEWNVSFWKEKATDTYEMMKRILSHNADNTVNASSDGTDRILNKVEDIIEDKLVVDRNEISIYARFVQDLGADSLDVVELVMEMEKVFGISIPDEDAEKIRTVGEAVDYIKSKLP